jgi:endonuclease-3 related protein
MSARLDEVFPALVAALAERYGTPAGLVRGEPLLASAAAVLADDVTTQAVAGARSALADAGLLDAEALAAADPVGVEEAFRESPLPLRRKSVATLQRFARWLSQQDGGDEERLHGRADENLREELAGINGVGRATADRLLLHALHRPVYPLDRTTYRVFVRHGWLDTSAEYDEARAVVERPLAGDADGTARFSRLMERVGREFCRVAAPRCERCPLRPWLPDGGPVEPV